MSSRPAPRPASNRGSAALFVTAILLVIIGVIVAIAFANRAPEGPAASGERIDGLVAADTRLLGEKGDSGVEFVVFGDFQCGGCAAAAPHVDGLREEFAEQVTFAFRNYPLDGHPYAMDAALAAEAAGRQDAFPEMHDLIYANQQSWVKASDPVAEFRAYAEQLGLDLDRFDADVASASVLAHVTDDREFSQSLGLRGTPSFFVDGVLLAPETYEDLRTAIVAALEG